MEARAQQARTTMSISFTGDLSDFPRDLEVPEGVEVIRVDEAVCI